MKRRGNLSAEQVDGLIDRIYEAAGDAERWDGAIGALCEAMGAESGVIWFKDLAADAVPLLLIHNQDPRTPALYAEYYHRKDVWFPACNGLPIGGVFEGEELVPWSDLQRTEFHSDFLRPFGLERIASTRLVNSAHQMSHCSLFRSARHESFDAQSMRFFWSLSPHLRRAVDLHLRLAVLGTERRQVEAALDALVVGVVIVDRTGRILFANRSAYAIGKRNDGLSLGSLGLCCGRTVDTRELRRKIHAAATIADINLRAVPASMVVPRSHGLRPYVVTVAPLRGAALDMLGSRGTAVLFITDPNLEPRRPSEILEQIYGLTPAEVRLAVALGAGKTLDDLVTAFGVAKTTLRTQLLQVFRKTGTSRQAELVLLVARHQSCLLRSQGES